MKNCVLRVVVPGWRSPRQRRAAAKDDVHSTVKLEQANMRDEFSPIQYIVYKEQQYNMLICFLLKFFSRRLIPSFGDDQAAEAEAALEKRPQSRIIKSSIHTVNNLSHIYYILHNTLHVFSFRLFFSVALQLIIKAQAR